MESQKERRQGEKKVAVEAELELDLEPKAGAASELKPKQRSIVKVKPTKTKMKSQEHKDVREGRRYSRLTVVVQFGAYPSTAAQDERCQHITCRSRDRNNHYRRIILSTLMRDTSEHVTCYPFDLFSQSHFSAFLKDNVFLTEKVDLLVQLQRIGNDVTFCVSELCQRLDVDRLIFHYNEASCNQLSRTFYHTPCKSVYVCAPRLIELRRYAQWFKNQTLFEDERPFDWTALHGGTRKVFLQSSSSRDEFISWEKWDIEDIMERQLGPQLKTSDLSDCEKKLLDVAFAGPLRDFSVLEETPYCGRLIESFPDIDGYTYSMNGVTIECLPFHDFSFEDLKTLSAHIGKESPRHHLLKEDEHFKPPFSCMVLCLFPHRWMNEYPNNTSTSISNPEDLPPQSKRQKSHCQ